MQFYLKLNLILRSECPFQQSETLISRTPTLHLSSEMMTAFLGRKTRRRELVLSQSPLVPEHESKKP